MNFHNGFLNTNNIATINNCSLLRLPKIENRAGNITPLENCKLIPFKIKRVFYIYDIPGGKDRGAHAHITCHQLLIAASGSFDVFLNDGKSQKTLSLNMPYFGLHIPPGIWVQEKNFSSGSICLVMASELFDEGDYIRDFNAFLNFKDEK